MRDKSRRERTGKMREDTRKKWRERMSRLSNMGVRVGEAPSKTHLTVRVIFVLRHIVLSGVAALQW